MLFYKNSLGASCLNPPNYLRGIESACTLPTPGCSEETRGHSSGRGGCTSAKGTARTTGSPFPERLPPKGFPRLGPSVASWP